MKWYSLGKNKKLNKNKNIIGNPTLRLKSINLEVFLLLFTNHKIGKDKTIKWKGVLILLRPASPYDKSVRYIDENNKINSVFNLSSLK